MTKLLANCMTIAAVAVCSAPAFGQGPEPIETEKVRRMAEVLVEKAAGIEKPQVKVEGEAARAVGLAYQRNGIIAVPQVGLVPEENPDVVRERGAALGYLFLSAAFQPVVSGKPVPADQQRSLKVVDQEGHEHTVSCLLLAVRSVTDDDWRLYAYGAGEKPLVEATFELHERANSGPLAIDVEDISNREGTLAITVFGKYKAGFRVAYSP